MTESINDLIDRLRELDKAASPAPWKFYQGTSGDVVEDDNSPLPSTLLTIFDGFSKDHLVLIESRNAVPILLDEIERLQAELRDTHQRYHDRFSRIAEGWRKRRMERIRGEKEEAWGEGFSAGHYFGARQMSFDPPEPKPYRKGETK